MIRPSYSLRNALPGGVPRPFGLHGVPDGVVGLFPFWVVTWLLVPEWYIEILWLWSQSDGRESFFNRCRLAKPGILISHRSIPCLNYIDGKREIRSDLTVRLIDP